MPVEDRPQGSARGRGKFAIRQRATGTGSRAPLKHPPSRLRPPDSAFPLKSLMHILQRTDAVEMATPTALHHPAQGNALNRSRRRSKPWSSVPAWCCPLRAWSFWH